jgi:hypothetical protein
VPTTSSRPIDKKNPKTDCLSSVASIGFSSMDSTTSSELAKTSAVLLLDLSVKSTVLENDLEFERPDREAKRLLETSNESEREKSLSDGEPKELLDITLERVNRVLDENRELAART